MASWVTVWLVLIAGLFLQNWSGGCCICALYSAQVLKPITSEGFQQSIPDVSLNVVINRVSAKIFSTSVPLESHHGHPQSDLPYRAVSGDDVSVKMWNRLSSSWSSFNPDSKRVATTTNALMSSSSEISSHRTAGRCGSFRFTRKVLFSQLLTYI